MPKPVPASENRRSAGRSAGRLNWPGVGCVLLVTLAWELSARQVGTSNYPPLSAVVIAVVSQWPVFGGELLVTLWRAAAGFLLALAVMLPAGVFIGRFKTIGQFIEPAIDLLRPLPPLAIVPIAMLFAGTGSAAKVLVVFYSAAFPILINAIDATRSTHPALINTARAIGLNRMQIMARIDLPAALPQLMSGVRLAIAVALLVSVSAEMLLSSDGIGNLVSRSQEQFQIADGLGAVLLIALVSLLINQLVRRLEGRLLAWHYGRSALAGQN